MAIATWGRSLADDTAAIPPCRTGDEAFPHPPSRPPNRRLAHDASTDRIDEIMHVSRRNGAPDRVWLRPAGGGKEWVAPAAEVSLVQADAPGGRP